MRLEELWAAVICEEHATIREVSHAVRGAAAQIGADELASMCADLERDSALGQVDDTLARLAEIQAAFHRVRIRLLSAQLNASKLFLRECHPEPAKDP